MEGLQKAMRGVMEQKEEASKFLSNISSSPSSSSSSTLASSPAFAADLSSDPSRLLVSRSPRQVVSLRTCSKLCAICFVAGVVVGYTLKRRVRRWASKLLRRIKDD